MEEAFNFRRTIRKIAAVGISTAMVGATLLGATAAAGSGLGGFELSKSTLVINDGASADEAAVAALGPNVGVAAAGAATTSSGTALPTGSFALEKSGDKFNLNDTITTVFGSIADSSNSPVLAKYTYTNDVGETSQVEQLIRLGPFNNTPFQKSGWNNREPSIGVDITATQPILNFTLNPGVDIKSVATTTTAATNPDSLSEFEKTVLKMVDKEMYVSDFTNTTSALTLIDSLYKDSLGMGEAAKTVEVEGKEYTIEVPFISTTQAQFVVNGVKTPTLSEGSSYIFDAATGFQVVVERVLGRDKDGTPDRVEFRLGKNKIETTGNNVFVKVNGKTDNRLKYHIKRTALSGSKYGIDEITFEWIADEEEFLVAPSSPGRSMVFPVLGIFELQGELVGYDKSEKITFGYDGQRIAQVELPIKSGTAVVPLLYSNGTSFIGIGKSATERLITSSNTTLQFNVTDASGGTAHRYAVISRNQTADAASHLVRFDVRETSSQNVTDVKDLVTGEVVCEEKAAGSTCNLAGGVSFTINEVHKSTGQGKWVRLTAGTDNRWDQLYTYGGGSHNANIQLPYWTSFKSYESGPMGQEGIEAGEYIAGFAGNVTRQGSVNFSAGAAAGFNSATWRAYIREQTRLGNVGTGIVGFLTTGFNSDNYVSWTAINTGTEVFTKPGSDNEVSWFRTDIGSKAERVVESRRGKVDVTHPTAETYLKVWVVPRSSTASVVSSGVSYAAVKTAGKTKLASQVTADDKKGMLTLVGGPCTQGGFALSADVAGACASWALTSGQALVKLMALAEGGQALVIAGTDAADTLKAAKFVAAGSLAGKTESELKLNTAGATATIALAAPSTTGTATGGANA